LDNETKNFTSIILLSILPYIASAQYYSGNVGTGSDNVDDVAWYGSNSGSKTHEVAIKAPNEIGLYDMSGYVYEWCQDW